MKLQTFLIVSLVGLFISCGSKKKIVSSTPKKVVVNQPVYTNKKIKQLEQIKKEPVRVTPQNTEEYVKQFAAIAMREMQLYKIPASITLAQGILESGSGRSNLALRSNNHFGIKCHKEWNGKSVTHDDDAIAECFRKYKHPETSYEDHSKFLTSRKRYAKLFKLKITDYKGWAYGLKRAGYATDRRYPQKLIGLIKKYNLTQYDKEALAKNAATTVVESENKTASYYRVKKGDTLYSIARRHEISVSKLKKINNLTNNTISIGQQLLVY